MILLTKLPIYILRTLQILFFIGALLFTSMRYSHIISLTNDLAVYSQSNDFKSGLNLSNTQPTFQYMNDYLLRASVMCGLLLGFVSILGLIFTSVRKQYKRHVFEGVAASFVLLCFTLIADVLLQNIIAGMP